MAQFHLFKKQCALSVFQKLENLNLFPFSAYLTHSRDISLTLRASFPLLAGDFGNNPTRSACESRRNTEKMLGKRRRYQIYDSMLSQSKKQIRYLKYVGYLVPRKQHRGFQGSMERLQK